MEEEATPVPPQYQDAAVTDFRRAALGPTGFKMCRKRKMEEYKEQADMEEQQMDESEQPARTRLATPKRQKLNTVGIGKGSGRTWKEPSTRASLLRNPLLATSWAKKMADKTQAQAFREARQASVDARKAKLQKARKQREESKARKEENRKKSVVTQRISNPATLKRMMGSKKQRKKLMTAA